MTDYDVIVAGCGPVGAVAANLLAKHNIRTLVIDKDHVPYDLPRAVHIDHEIMRIFQSAGMADALMPHLHVTAGAITFGMNGTIIRQFKSNLRTNRLGWASDYFFYQPDLERAMRAVLETRDSVETLWGHSVDEVTQDADGVAIVANGADGPRRFTARYLLGCDGGRSNVRRQIGVTLKDLDFHEPWVVIDALVDGPITMPATHRLPEGADIQQTLIMTGDPTRPYSIIPGIGRHRRWEFMLMPGETAQDYEDPALARDMIAPFVKDAQCDIIRSVVYTFHALMAEQWRKDRVFLVGDAAHQTPPFFGQGLCHGIRDASNLAWKLKLVLDGAASPTLLESYQPERFPQVQTIIGTAIRLGRNLCTFDREVAARRDAELGPIAAKVKPGYVEIIPPLNAGILGESGDGPGAIGSRFIQPPMLAADGRRGLLDDLAGGGFVILAKPDIDAASLASATRSLRRIGIRTFTIEPASVDEASGSCSLVDDTGELFAWFDAQDCAGVLLRPDAYVYATFSTAAEASEILARLDDQIGNPAVMSVPETSGAGA